MYSIRSLHAGASIILWSITCWQIFGLGIGQWVSPKHPFMKMLIITDGYGGNCNIQK